MADKAASRKAALRKYHETHKDERRKQNQEWYAKQAGTGYNTKKRKKRSSADFSRVDWEWILRVYDGRCLRCGTQNDVHRDHVIPVDDGGDRGGDNLQPLCVACNSKKKTRHDDYRRGTIVKLLGLGYHGRGMM